MSYANSVIQIQGLYKQYGKFTAVKGIDFEIQRGEVFGLIGPDGAGKTTTFHILGGVMEATAGNVQILRRTPREARLGIGYLTQQFSLYLDLSIDENLRYSAGLRQVPDKLFQERRSKYLHLMNLEKFGSRLAGQLSGGMKQKLALCCALVAQPQVLLLDEPTTGVDPVSRREFWDVLAALSKEGVTIVVATPYLDEAERCHRIALMYDGKIHQIGTMAELRTSLGLQRLEVRTSDIERAEKALLEAITHGGTGITDVQTFGDRLDVLAKNVSKDTVDIREILKQHQLPATIEPAEPTLENVFVTRLRQQGSDPPFIQFPRSRKDTGTRGHGDADNERMFGKSQNLPKNPSPNLSPTGGEVLKPPFPTREGGVGGLGFGGFDVNTNTFQTSSENAGIFSLFASSSSTLSEASPIAIGARHLWKTFGNFHAAKDVNLEVRYGEIYGLLGANGAGKTTTIKMLCGLLSPTAGEVALAGQVGNLRNPEVRQRIGYMSQKFTLYDDLSVIQNLEFYCGVYGVPRRLRRTKIDWVLETCGLVGQENMLTGRLPGGWKQRVAFGASVMHEPEILFLDEPTSGVDPLARRQFWRLIDDFSRHGTAVLVTTHYLEEAEHCHRMGFMVAGEMVAQGSPSQIKAEQPGQLIEVVIDQTQIAYDLLKQHFQPWQVSLFGSSLHIVLEDPDRDVMRVRSLLESENLQIRSLRPVPFSLEDAFIGIVQRAQGRV